MEKSMMNDDMMVDVDGLKCVCNDTSSLEAWLIMHGFRRVLCGGEDFPARKGHIAHFASCGLMQKEIDFIEEMNATGAYPPVDMFMEQSGLIGVTDYEVVEETDLPGWDGSPNPVVLSNPRWYIDGKLVPVPPDVIIDDGPSAGSRHGGNRSSRRRRDLWRR